MAKVYRSAVIDAAADKVWALVRDFNALPKWHPAIAQDKWGQTRITVATAKKVESDPTSGV